MKTAQVGSEEKTLCHFKCASVKTLTEGQNCFTTKDTKEPEDEALDRSLEPGGCSTRLVYYTPQGATAQPIIAFDSSSSSILRVLRALRGEFSSTSGLASQPACVLWEPESEVATHSKRQGSEKNNAEGR